MKVPKIESNDLIIKKMRGEKLKSGEIRTILDDILSGKIGEMEIIGWLAALHIYQMDDDELIEYTRAMAESGLSVKFGDKDVYDFHSIGGVPGNKITPIIVSIVSASGLLIPKTSTHAISGACGTVDFVETFCRTEFTKKEMVAMADKTNGFFIENCRMNISSVDDIIITVQHKIKLNPYSQFLSSILGMKSGMGASNLIIEIPSGPGTKVETIDEAKSMAEDFIRFGKKLGIHTHIFISDAKQPVGYTIGPILEARECISALQNPENAPKDVIEKVCRYSASLMEMGGMADTEKKAHDILFSGKAYQKFREIVEIQEGNPDIKPEDLALGDAKVQLVSPADGYVSSIDNKKLITIARKAGAPAIKVAGIFLHKKIGDKISKGDVLMDIYSDSMDKADDALKFAEEIMPYGYSSNIVEKTENIILDYICSQHFESASRQSENHPHHDEHACTHQ